MNRRTEIHQIFHNIPPYHLSILALVHSSKDRIGGHSREFGSQSLEVWNRQFYYQFLWKSREIIQLALSKLRGLYVELRLFQGNVVVLCIEAG